MSETGRRGPRSRRQVVVESLARRIRSGAMPAGQRLDGEFSLAEEFSVSRGTIRQALGDLAQMDLIATHAGRGSFVTFDGVALDAEQGWASALAEAGTEVRTEVLSIEAVGREEVPDLPAHAVLEHGVAVRRLRRTADGLGVSFECSTLPAVGPLADLPGTGLVDGSISASLRAAGLVSFHGSQDLSAAPLPAREAGLLGRRAGEPFLRSVRTSYELEHRLVEHVVSYLDPAHFRFHLTFGETS